MRLVCSTLVLLLAQALFAASPSVDPKNTYHRVFAVVPVTESNPRRPLHTPTPDQIGPRSGIIGFTAMFSDDGNWALIELVAPNRSTLLPILSDKSIHAFEKGVATTAAIESAFQAHQPSFHFSQFDEVNAR
jgi:hypothetical protein